MWLYCNHDGNKPLTCILIVLVLQLKYRASTFFSFYLAKYLLSLSKLGKYVFQIEKHHFVVEKEVKPVVHFYNMWNFLFIKARL